MKNILKTIITVAGITFAATTFSIGASAQTQPATGMHTTTCPNGRMNNRCIMHKKHHHHMKMHMKHHMMHHMKHHHMMMKQY